MEMLQLRYFYETARLGSFARTAEKYMVPPTSVSASVKRLEKELGCLLFHRSHNRITLNEQGKRLQNSLRVVFGELDEVVEELSSTTDTREIRLLVRAMRLQITDCIVAYRKNYPHIPFKTVFDLEETDVSEYDIIVDEESERYDGYDRFDLFRARVRIVACDEHPLCGQKVTLRQLKDYPFISVGQQNCLFRILTQACERVGFTPRIAVQTNDLLCQRRFVQAGIGLGFYREYDGKTPPNVQCIDVTDFNEMQTICVYYNPSANYGNVRHFLHFLQNYRDNKTRT